MEFLCGEKRDFSQFHSVKETLLWEIPLETSSFRTLLSFAVALVTVELGFLLSFVCLLVFLVTPFLFISFQVPNLVSCILLLLKNTFYWKKISNMRPKWKQISNMRPKDYFSPPSSILIGCLIKVNTSTLRKTAKVLICCLHDSVFGVYECVCVCVWVCVCVCVCVSTAIYPITVILLERMCSR